jgi:U3 small nucleolar RNA-associated protein 19
MAPSPSYQSLLKGPMTFSQRKALLRQLQDTNVISSLKRPEILMDFFTDCLDSGDAATAVSALSGIFFLITSRNLDYPSFFPRVYSLLDPNLLHSKYRSRVLRHLDTFLAPTNHLPAATIASFIKRLSRLCLTAPPAAIVAIVPFIYNLLRHHPTCTFMIHRKPFPPYTTSKENLGEDPFNMAEKDPQRTGAIDSSLWELETLQSHYHPTVSSIARIISEQFTKQQYNIEDFLDHGYGSMMESELAKEAKKPPVVEHYIPKTIFRRMENSENPGPLLDFWEF